MLNGVYIRGAFRDYRATSQRINLFQSMVRGYFDNCSDCAWLADERLFKASGHAERTHVGEDPKTFRKVAAVPITARLAYSISSQIPALKNDR